ncbi:MAG: PH domain-containing protein [Nitriliruptorales bacterium]
MTPEPGTRQGEFLERPLDPRIVLVWRIMLAVAVAFPLLAAAALAFLFLAGLGWLVSLAGLALIALLVAWYPRARYDRWRWQLGPLALELRHGVVVHQREAVPYFRIQQIDITRDPFDRMLGLASLRVTTASATGNATIPGIAAAEAPLVRGELLARAAVEVSKGEINDAV